VWEALWEARRRGPGRVALDTNEWEKGEAIKVAKGLIISGVARCEGADQGQVTDLVAEWTFALIAGIGAGIIRFESS
jgi:hypothetical protein